LMQPVRAVDPNQEILLTLKSRNATVPTDASNIYAVNGRALAHISNLLDLMGSHGLLFYRSNTAGPNRGPSGLIARDDVVLIKINEEWPERGGTNTDVLKELIQAIVNHPDGFVGEIVVADNGQWGGSMDWWENNAEDPRQSTQDVVNMFSPPHNVSTYTWRPIRGIRVEEYSEGNMTDGYILYDAADPETGIYVSYPKFQTKFGTYISFKYGIWNGTHYENRLRVINLPVLKSHKWYGVTAALKHYMGVQSEGQMSQGDNPGLANGHQCVATGGMGTLMVETGLPTLNIVDAIWVNANPPPEDIAGPGTPYESATRVNVLIASTDPVALDYWSAKHVLVQAAERIGYSDTHTLDPDNTNRNGVIGEAFGVWLNKTKDEILRGGYQVTTSEEQMNVYVSALGYELNLRILDWDLTDPIEGARVYADEEVKVSDSEGWANWTKVGGNTQIKVKYFGKLVNGTFSLLVEENMTIDVQCNIFDIRVVCLEGLQGAVLENANVTVFNSTSTPNNKICTGITDASGKVDLNNVPNGTLTSPLTFTVYGENGNSIVANVTRTICVEYPVEPIPVESITCDKNCVTVQQNWKTQISCIFDSGLDAPDEFTRSQKDIE